jgi:O-antigen ligase
MISPPASAGSHAPRATDLTIRRLNLLGAGLVVALPVAMWLANRSAPLMFGLAAAALLAAAVIGEGLQPALLRARAALSSPIGLALTLFLLWALISVAWSHRLAPGLAMWGELALPLICGLGLVASRQLQPTPRFYRALALALIAAAVLMMLELSIGLSQRVMLGLGKGVNRTDVFNRPVLTSLILTAAVLPVLWRQQAGGSFDRALCLLTAVLVAVATLVSESGAAKLGLLVMAATWCLALLAPRLTLALVAIGFTMTMLTAPVIGRLVDRAIPEAVHKQLASSHSRARVDIWLSFGEAIRVHPLIGSGFGATAALENHPVAQQVSPAHREMLAVGHPHSAPIQAWTETGAIGALLLGFAGLACLWRLRWLRPGVLAPRLALFASAFAVASVAHGAWQGWWIASLAAGAALLWLSLPETALQTEARDSGHG